MTDEVNPIFLHPPVSEKDLGSKGKGKEEKGDKASRPERPEKSDKTRTRKCNMCNHSMPDSYKKPICKVCIDNFMREEKTSFLDELKGFIEEKVVSSIAAATSRAPPYKKPRLEPGSSPSEAGSDSETPSCSIIETEDSLNPQDFIKSAESRHLFPIDELDNLLKAIRQTLEIEDVVVPQSKEDELFGGLKAKRQRVFPLNDTLKELVSEEWKEPEKRILISKNFRKRLLGSSASSKVDAGFLDRGDFQKVVQLPRTEGGLGGTQLKHCSTSRTPPVDTVRQYHNSILPEEARGNQIPITDVLNKTNIFVGRGPCPINLGYPSKGNREHNGGFPQPKENTSQRVVHKRRDIPVPVFSLGETSNRFIRNKKKHQVSTLFFLGKRRDKRSSGCILPLLEHHSRLRLPPYSPDRQSVRENLSREDADHICVPKLAQKELVPDSEADDHSGSSHATSIRRSPGTGSNIPSKSRKTPVISMDPESDYMKSQGLSPAVINTLKASRKPVTFAIYHKIWKKFSSFCADKPPCQSNPNVLQVLDFLQKGLELGLSTSTLKVQVSALSDFFDQPLIEHRWVKRFILAASRLKPQVLKRTSSWDLSLVLNALIKEPFEPISSASVKNLTLKTVFLVAITSARRLGELQAISIKEPYMRVLDDRIILMLDPNFIPKVVSEFHRGQEIILPSFCKNPSSEREREWHTLDGKNKGRKASKATIARWLRMAISSCYDIQEIPVPSGIRAHSTRAVSTSWAEKRGASLEQICKAATWTSSSTFSKHYRLDLPSSKDLSFGRKVLQAVIPP
ncbi:uncharacterized protein [Engystomops pustulosus]|uniref:uncharacterized protein n=1 Tax=Engystomops pustulosus TaxID=76066 RepID=UPI003AFB57E9